MKLAFSDARKADDLRDFHGLRGAFGWAPVFPCSVQELPAVRREGVEELVTTSPAPTAFTRMPCPIAFQRQRAGDLRQRALRRGVGRKCRGRSGNMRRSRC